MSIVETHTDGPEGLKGRPVPAYSLTLPEREASPVIFASPHSGRHYPDDFVASLRVPLIDLRQTEDAFVDELFADATKHGPGSLAAEFPRSYIDPNRAISDIDPDMIDGVWTGLYEIGRAHV